MSSEYLDQFAPSRDSLLHMRELIEQGFEVTVVEDATAGAKTPAGDAHKVAVANFHYIANAVVTTDQAVAAIQAAFGKKAGQ